jgi:hypothetical protein
LDTADTKSVDDGESDVTIFTPWGAPRVFNDPVVLSTGRVVAPADSKYGVIEGGSASSWVENATSVSLEDCGVSFNRDSKGLEGKSSFELGDVTSWDVSLADNVNLGGVSSVVCAGLGDSLVGIVGLRNGVGVLGEVSESSWLVTTVAAEGKVNTVDELLFREQEAFTWFDPVSSFEGASGWESPAWTALTLVFNSGDGSLGDPVDDVSVGLWEIGGCWYFDWSDVAEHLLELLWSHVGEFVVANSEGVWTVVVNGGEFFVSLGEECLSEFELFNGGVGLAVGGDVLHELGGELGSWDSANECEGCECLHDKK